MIRQLAALTGAMALSIALGAGMVNLAIAEAHGATDQDPPIRTEWMPCGQEDSRNCVWEAKHRGNGLGHSLFVSRQDRVWVLPHHIAHRLLYGFDGRVYSACETPVTSDPVLCIWEERVWLGREGNDWPIPASIGRYLLSR